jgi:hypothetical protein
MLSITSQPTANLDSCKQSVILNSLTQRLLDKIQIKQASPSSQLIQFTTCLIMWTQIPTWPKKLFYGLPFKMNCLNLRSYSSPVLLRSHFLTLNFTLLNTYLIVISSLYKAIIKQCRAFSGGIRRCPSSRLAL